jgi:hypothetical protein
VATGARRGPRPIRRYVGDDEPPALPGRSSGTSPIVGGGAISGHRRGADSHHHSQSCPLRDTPPEGSGRLRRRFGHSSPASGGAWSIMRSSVERAPQDRCASLRVPPGPDFAGVLTGPGRGGLAIHCARPVASINTIRGLGRAVVSYRARGRRPLVAGLLRRVDLPRRPLPLHAHRAPHDDHAMAPWALADRLMGILLHWLATRQVHDKANPGRPKPSTWHEPDR